MPSRSGQRSTRVKTTNVCASSARLIRVFTPLSLRALPTVSTGVRSGEWRAIPANLI